jgi:hypothetical protein
MFTEENMLNYIERDESDIKMLKWNIKGCIQKLPDWISNETTTINTCWEVTQRVMATKLTRLTHKIAIQLQLVAESCTICSSRSRRPVRKLLDISSYNLRSLKGIIDFGMSRMRWSHARSGFYSIVDMNNTWIGNIKQCDHIVIKKL